MAKHTLSHRLPEFDVVRAVVLIGVFMMNYIVQWNVEEIRRTQGWGRIDAPGWLRATMDPWTGPLATRFAATLTMLVGVGIVLLSAKSVASGDAVRIREDRWRLRRRGALFVLIGIFFDVVWPGEILHFAGLFLIFGAWVIRWRTPTLFLAAATVMVVTAVQRALVFANVGEEEVYSWWGGFSSQTGQRSLGTPRGFLSNVLSWGGHPLLPWLCFVFVGMAIAKLDLRSAKVKTMLLGCGAAAVAAGYALRFIGERLLPDRWKWMASTEPGGFGRFSPFGKSMPAYVVATVGSSVFFLVLVLWIAQRFSNSLPIRVLARGGKVTFTIYVAHGVIPWLLADRKWVGQDFGLLRSMLIAVGSWFAAMVIGASIHRTFGYGPLEWLLRRFSGDARGPYTQVSAGSPSPLGEPAVDTEVAHQ
jgi:uncharacterized protein